MGVPCGFASSNLMQSFECVMDERASERASERTNGIGGSNNSAFAPSSNLMQ